MRPRIARPLDRWVRAATRAALPAAVLAASVVGVGPVTAWGQAIPGKAAPGASDCGTNVVVDLTANGSTVCVQRGGDLVVMLSSTGGSWSAPRVDGVALGSAMAIPTPYGTVGWMFPAVAAGTASVSLVRSNCPPPDPATGTCRPPLVYRVHAQVP
ncbi:hypothetical protein [Actinoallomurus rhizosphaericola]|uniref:hypothetical protein n=1 Tax=Actinoallomurus rhizosphaericola TaxID=2952536 RepID=UPI002091D6BE|nr:hypothetical protein [Actinoallomurus rhizosphaericola]MCO5993909.1 hypothetical protein [Actinoallomurus rhizosphaericola]